MICAGATKAGTSWLYDHLSRHPDCHFRTIKELHYFDTVEKRNFNARIRAHKAERDALKSRGGDLTAEQRRRIAARIADLDDWIGVLSARAADDAAYRAYVAQGAGARLVGDVTPSYGTLGVDTLRRIAAVARDVRFVYLMRDPVARLWSHVRMLARRELAAGGDYAALARVRMAAVLAGQESGVLLRGDYRGALERMAAAVAPGRLLTLFTEELVTLPGVRRLCGFLGIGVAETRFDLRVHEGVPLDMTDEDRAGARRLLRDQYEYIADRFPALPDAWQKTMSEGFA